MSDEDTQLLKNIRQHLFNLHSEWANDKHGDGHHKSNEGYVGVFLYYPNWFEAADYINDTPEVGCEVYSYLFGPHRLHEYKTLKEAWNEIKDWRYYNDDINR